MAAILGVLKAGKIYVSLDPALPRAQLTSMLKSSQASLIVTNNKYTTLVSDLAQDGPPCLNLDKLDTSLSSNLVLSLSPDTLCCIYYSSGSTGQPKRAVQNHRNMLHAMMNFTNDMHVCADDRLTLLHSYSFSASLTHVYGALLNGAACLSFNLPEEGADAPGSVAHPGGPHDLLFRPISLSPFNQYADWGGTVSRVARDPFGRRAGHQPRYRVV